MFLYRLQLGSKCIPSPCLDLAPYVSALIRLSVAGSGDEHSALYTCDFVGQWAYGSEFTECGRDWAAGSSTCSRQTPSGPVRVMEAVTTGTAVHILQNGSFFGSFCFRHVQVRSRTAACFMATACPCWPYRPSSLTDVEALTYRVAVE